MKVRNNHTQLRQNPATKWQDIVIAQTPLLVLATFTLFFSTMLKAETSTVVGEEAELIMKYGTISDTRCDTIDDMQWKFCTSLVTLGESTRQLIGWDGAWECSFHHNYAGHHVNVICLRQYPKH